MESCLEESGIKKECDPMQARNPEMEGETRPKIEDYLAL